MSSLVIRRACYPDPSFPSLVSNSNRRPSTTSTELELDLGRLGVLGGALTIQVVDQSFSLLACVSIASTISLLLHFPHLLSTRISHHLSSLYSRHLIQRKSTRRCMTSTINHEAEAQAQAQAQAPRPTLADIDLAPRRRLRDGTRSNASASGSGSASGSRASSVASSSNTSRRGRGGRGWSVSTTTSSGAMPTRGGARRVVRRSPRGRSIAAPDTDPDADLINQDQDHEHAHEHEQQQLDHPTGVIGLLDALTNTDDPQAPPPPPPPETVASSSSSSNASSSSQTRNPARSTRSTGRRYTAAEKGKGRASGPGADVEPITISEDEEEDEGIQITGMKRKTRPRAVEVDEQWLETEIANDESIRSGDDEVVAVTGQAGEDAVDESGRLSGFSEWRWPWAGEERRSVLRRCQPVQSVLSSPHEPLLPPGKWIVPGVQASQTWPLTTPVYSGHILCSECLHSSLLAAVARNPNPHPRNQPPQRAPPTRRRGKKIKVAEKQPVEWTAVTLREAWVAAQEKEYEIRARAAGMDPASIEAGREELDPRATQVQVTMVLKGLWKVDERYWVVEGECPVCRMGIPGGYGPPGKGIGSIVHVESRLGPKVKAL